MSKQRKKLVITSSTGSGKKRTIPACNASILVDVVAIHGRNHSKLAELKEENTHLVVFDDLETMLSSIEFDLIYIASPPFLHRSEIESAVKTKKPIICEKPLANNIDDAQAIYDLIKKSNIPFMLAHHLRHQEAVKHIDKVLRSNSLGEVRNAMIQWNFEINVDSANAKWKLDPQLGGGNAFFDAGIHAIDLAIFFWGVPKSVYANEHNNLSVQSVDTVTAILSYEGFNVILNASQNQSIIGNDVQIYCEKGVISAQQLLVEKSTDEVVIRTEEGTESIEFNQENLYKNEVETFCKQLDSVSTELRGTTVDEAILGMRVLEAIKNSLETKKTVNL